MSSEQKSAAEQLADLAKTSNLLRDFNSRQVDGGFVLNGQTRYVDKETGGVVASIAAEAVAGDAATAASYFANFSTTGKFK